MVADAWHPPPFRRCAGARTRTVGPGCGSDVPLVCTSELPDRVRRLGHGRRAWHGRDLAAGAVDPLTADARAVQAAGAVGLARRAGTGVCGCHGDLYRGPL